jgi:hypothetical protein
MSDSTSGVEDVVGDRVLVGLQSVRISRLSTHPVPVAVGTLIVVAGQGPTDSNGAGKSSLIAQISLLHADEQWRFGSGAPAAVDLLFNAEDAGGEDRWGNADHGYLIGVFAPSAAGAIDQLQASSLTVWIRVDRSSQKGPRLKLRWQDGLHLPVGDSEAEREQAADSLWQALPLRAGRQDVGARDLPRMLYGEHVRCVSFLSTSVRASVTPNLLAQPLNEISERRIFEAIAALTGIDHELEKERQARRHEYDRLQEARDAESELASWEESAQVIEDGIDARDRARGQVAEAAGRWRSRTARLLCDALQRDADIQAEISGIDTEIERDSRTAHELAGQAADLADDEAFTQRQQAAMSTFARLDGDDRELGNQIATLEQQIEDADRLLRAAKEKARDADGRDEPTADRERANADFTLEEAVKAVGVTESTLAAAGERLRDAESGRDLARQQIDLLAAEGIGAIALLDAIALNDQQRPQWEPALWPYRDAAVVDSAELDRAAVLLADVPGSILITANRATSAPLGSLPGNADPQYDLGAFLAALDARTIARREPGWVHDDAGIVIIGGFLEPVTGRAARIAAAREHVRRASTRHRDADETMKAAKQQVAAAERRQKGARAAAEAGRLDGQLDVLRKKDHATRDERAKLAPALGAAQTERDEVIRLAAVRRQQIDSLQNQKSVLDTANKSRREAREDLEKERAQVSLPELAAEWDGTPDSASEYLLDLPDNQQAWTADDWWEEARDLITTAVSECFPPTASAGMPTEIAGLFPEFSQRGARQQPAGTGRLRSAAPRAPRLPAPPGRHRPVRAPADRRPA